MTEQIKIGAEVKAEISKVWGDYTDPKAIVAWNSPSGDWHTTSATNDLKVGGEFSYRMEARDGSAGFDFMGTYTAVEPNERLEYALDDGRKVSVTFAPSEEGTKVAVVFDPETENPLEMQRAGWQAILDNFKQYTETN